MSVYNANSNPLVSIIIPCYNHAHYLPKALESVFIQQYPSIEIIVVDDGSVDNTKEVALSYPQVKYVYQQNSGLSAARNTGIKNSSGEYLVFLDADDWLYPEAIQTNAEFLNKHTEIAFVSGDYDFAKHDVVFKHGGYEPVTANHYIGFLQKNYIGMIATVMFRRWVFKEFLYDTSLKTCEDYDLYLRITRKYKVKHHSVKIAVYRFHGSNMSGNLPAMLKGVLEVLKKQKKELRTESEKKAYAKGIKLSKKYYSKELYIALATKKAKANKDNLLTLLRFEPLQLAKYFFKTFK